MGIYAKGSQFPANVEADSPQNRYGDQLTKDSPGGEALGEVIADVNATASSANTTTGELIGDIEALEGRVSALEGGEGGGGGTPPDLSEVDSFGGFQPASVDVDTLLAEGTNSNSRVYYRMASGGSTPDSGAGVLDVTNAGYTFIQVFYSTTNNAIYQRTITDRSHIVPDQWVYGDWVKVLNDVDLSGYAPVSRVSTLEGRVTTLEDDPGPDLSGYAPVSRVSTLEGRVSTLEDAPGLDLSEVDSFGGFHPSSVSVDTLLAEGTNSNSRVYYRMASGGSTPDGGAGVLDVTNAGYTFTQVFYSTTNNAIYQRTITDRSHIVAGQWLFGDWVKVLTDVDLSGYAPVSRVSTLEGRVTPLEGRVTTLENDPGPDLSGYAPVSRVSTLEGRVTPLEGRVSSLENDPGPDLSGLVSYGGFHPASVDIDTLLAGGTNSNSRVYYRMASGGSTPDGGAGVLDVTNTGYTFTQVFYSTTNTAIYQRVITDRSHIVAGQWLYGDWVKVLNEGDLSGYAPVSRVSTLEGRVDSIEQDTSVPEHTHTTSDISGLGTALNGKANSSHTHSQSQITGLSAALDGKANSSHTHSQSQITGLSAALDGKANSSHTHTTSDISGLGTALNGKANSSHTHSQSQITGLSAALDGKANSSHTHTTSDISGLGTALNGKANSSHTHTSADITDTTAFVDSSMNQAGRIPRTGTGGWLYSRDNPTHENHLARKGYVDQKVSALEGRVSAMDDTSYTSGTGWSAWSRHGVTTLTFTGISEGFTLPAGYRPGGTVHGSFSYARDSVGARFIINTAGNVTLVGTIPNPAFGTVTFVS